MRPPWSSTAVARAISYSPSGASRSRSPSVAAEVARSRMKLSVVGILSGMSSIPPGRRFGTIAMCSCELAPRALQGELDRDDVGGELADDVRDALLEFVVAVPPLEAGTDDVE